VQHSLEPGSSVCSFSAWEARLWSLTSPHWLCWACFQRTNSRTCMFTKYTSRRCACYNCREGGANTTGVHRSLKIHWWLVNDAVVTDCDIVVLPSAPASVRLSETGARCTLCRSSGLGRGGDTRILWFMTHPVANNNTTTVVALS